jgi:hypothetical protein
MPSAENIQLYLTGAWRMMLGKADGLRLLDLSADGFWNSFFAIVIALPPLTVSWVGTANELSQLSTDLGSKFSIVARLATIDLASWILPLVAFAAIVSRVGLADRFVHFVVSGNWASALFIWVTVPISLARLIWPLGPEVQALLWFVLIALNLVVSWRVTHVALGKGAAVTTAVFAGMLFLSVVIQGFLMAAFGLGQTA